MMRWTPRRKVEFLAVQDGEDNVHEFCERNGATTDDIASVTAEEIAQWRRLLGVYGLRGLRTTRLQSYRSKPGL